MQLIPYGWNIRLEDQFKPWKEKGFFPARVVAEFKNLYHLLWQQGEVEASVSGKMMYSSKGRIDYPAVGDFVVLDVKPPFQRGVIHAILPRKSQFIRKMAGKEKDIQIVASNIDYVFIVNALDHDFNLRRIERYLTLSWESGASPVILLNKADLGEAWEEKMAKVEKISMGCPVHAISCYTGDGFKGLSPYLKEGITTALLGSSGVGKSSVINYLLHHQVQKTNDVRSGDDHGRHTTTSRQLFLLPQGGMMIDTPGMRELQLVGTEKSLEGTFLDIASLAKHCRFANCQHREEPGCAVREAIERGQFEESRLISFEKQQRELRFVVHKETALVEKKKRFKEIAKKNKVLKKTFRN